MFDTLLIANRGEIACRVIRTARAMGLRTVAVYSDADAQAQHVRLADTAVRLGPAPAAESYLRSAAVLEAARATGAGAIHPGYGFLSENAAFAEACADAGLTFVGPPASAIRAMGSKSEAKKLMGAAGVPLTPGYHGDDQADQRLFAEAEQIGWPVLLKAAAGGGGKGMRAVHAADDFAEALAGCRRESKASFDDDHMLVEKLIQRPRHVEVQVFCDTLGNGVYLFERDCSVQRRHQKVLEEAPAPGMTAELRREMGEAAVAAARAVDYVGAGTVEFLLDAEGRFYFMEMNTRLQVEHPVTELVTGQDLVAWQLQVAAGQPLPCTQDDLTLDGHAIEARIYAEDPDNDFMPATGTLTTLRLPQQVPGVRVDTGVQQGDTVSAHYDPMVAKLIVHGADRAEALRRLDAALAAWRMQGVRNNVDFLRRVARSDAFASGAVHTGLLAELPEDALATPASAVQDALLAAVLHAPVQRAAATRQGAGQAADPWSPWGCADAFRLDGPAVEGLVASVAGERFEVRVETSNARDFQVSLTPIDGGELQTHVVSAAAAPNGILLVRDGVRQAVDVAVDGDLTQVFLPSASLEVVVHDVGAEHEPGTGADAGFGAPMTGKLVANLVEPGAAVEAGAALVVMEAMKMEYTVTAPVAGSVEAFHYAPGDQVEEGAELLSFTPAVDG